MTRPRPGGQRGHPGTLPEEVRVRLGPEFPSGLAAVSPLVRARFTPAYHGRCHTDAPIYDPKERP